MYKISRFISSLSMLTLCVFCLCLGSQTRCYADVLSLRVPSVYSSTLVWLDEHGEKVQIANWKGKAAIISMAYTECTRICNASLHKLEETQALADKNHQELEFFVISFDPTIDNPASWRFYRKKHKLSDRTNGHFLTGTESTTRRLANLLDIRFWKDEDHIMHDLKILAINPDGSIKSFLDWDHQDVKALF